MFQLKRKSLGAFACILSVMLILLCSCGSSTASSVSTDSKTNTNAEEIVHIALNDSPNIYTASSTGVYSIQQIRPGSFNLFYADAATRQETYLCAVPNCTHSSDECTSYVSMENGLYGFSLGFYKDHLYLFQSATTDEYAPYLMQLDPDGTNRKVIASLNDGESFVGNVYGYRNTILCDICGVSEQDSPYRTLIQIDLNTGKRTDLISYPQGDVSYTLMGASKTELIYLAANEDGSQYFTVDPSEQNISLKDAQAANAITELFDGNDLIYTVQQDYLCKYDRSSNELSYQNLNTKETHSFPAPELPEEDTLYGLVYLFDDHFALSLENGSGKSFEAIIDSQTGELTGVELSFSKEDQRLILGEFGDELICLHAMEETMLKDQGNYGLIGEPTELPVYQLISKTDYLNGKPGTDFECVYN